MRVDLKVSKTGSQTAKTYEIVSNNIRTVEIHTQKNYQTTMISLVLYKKKTLTFTGLNFLLYKINY